MSDEPCIWTEALTGLSKSLADVRIAREDMPKDVSGWLSSTTLGLNTKANGVCDHFHQYGRFPRIESDLRCLVLLRVLFCMHALSERRDRAYHHFGDATAEDWINHFLTVGWYHDWSGWSHAVFDGRWKLPFDPWSI